MPRTDDSSGAGPAATRFGLNHAALEAAILAALEESGQGLSASVIASAVATAIEANNRELLRQLKESLNADQTSTERR
jgi:hypothetical protein